MRLLAIDTSGPAASAATYIEDHVICQAMLEDKKTHSEKIMGLIEFVLTQSNLQKCDLEAIAVTTGPGSFTGLRIGLSIAKAMAQALNIPCIGINTLDALCYAAGGANLRCALMDARRKEVYCTAYRGDALVVEHGVRSLAEFLELIRPLQEPALFIGDGVRAYRSEISHTLEKACFMPEPYTLQTAACVVMLAAKADKELIKDAYILEATYYRQSQAEREAAQRQQ